MDGKQNYSQSSHAICWLLLTVRMYISIMALGQQTISTSRSAMLRLRRKRLVEDLIDLEVRMTMRTRTFPTTPTARTRLKRTKLV